MLTDIYSLDFVTVFATYILPCTETDLNQACMGFLRHIYNQSKNKSETSGHNNVDLNTEYSTLEVEGLRIRVNRQESGTSTYSISFTSEYIRRGNAEHLRPLTPETPGKSKVLRLTETIDK